MKSVAEGDSLPFAEYRESPFGRTRVVLDEDAGQVELYVARYSEKTGERVEDRREVIYPSMLYTEREGLLERIAELDAQIALYEEAIQGMEKEGNGAKDGR